MIAQLILGTPFLTSLYPFKVIEKENSIESPRKRNMF